MARSARWARVAAAAIAVAALTGLGIVTTRADTPAKVVLAPSVLPAPDPAATGDCSLRLVAGGDGLVEGNDASGSGTDDKAKAYPKQLLEEHLQKAPGPWCLYNTSGDKVTSGGYYADGNPTQQSLANDLDPALITLTLGRENTGIFAHVDTCLDFIRDHDFIEANVCALAVFAAQPIYNSLHDDLSNILNGYRVQQDGNPNLVVAVTGYFNPYPSATDVATKIPGFCSNLVDVIPTCLIRWLLLIPALVTLDLVVKKLNTTVEEVVHEFEVASQGRFVFVNPYDKFKGHCMEMDVRIDISVYHPTNTVDMHNTDKDMGCDTDSWVGSDGDIGTKLPLLYLAPAVTGVLLTAIQTTRNMGLYPNEKGHDCISDLIWEAVKIKLGVPEPPASSVCEG